MAVAVAVGVGVGVGVAGAPLAVVAAAAAGIEMWGCKDRKELQRVREQGRGVLIKSELPSPRLFLRCLRPP